MNINKQKGLRLLATCKQMNEKTLMHVKGERSRQPQKIRTNLNHAGKTYEFGPILSILRLIRENVLNFEVRAKC